MIVIEKYLLPKAGEYKYFDYPEFKNELLVYRDNNDQIKIYSSFCPHFGGPLQIKDDKLYCWFHAYEFDIDNGSCKNRKADISCSLIEFKDTGSGIVIEVI